MTLLREFIREAMETKSEPTRMPLNIPIPADLRKISDMFSAEGQELYIVGGAVRDTLLNKSPKDYDLATGAAPDAVLDIVSKDPGSKVDLTGKSFGVVRVNTDEGNEYEIATFRKDIGTGRRPDSVEFTSIEDDVKRRDLTINALFYDMDSREVVDYVGGIEDIKSGVIKAVGDPKERFQEDKLRILRAVRFAARMGSDLDAETESAIMKDNDLTEVSPERTRDELIKGIASAQNIGHFLGLLDRLDLFPQIFPGLKVNPGAPDAAKDVPAQLALILADNDPKQVVRVLKSMKYTNEEVDIVAFMLKFSGVVKETAPAMKKEFNRIKLQPEQLQAFTKPYGVAQNIVDAFLKFVEAPPAASPKDLMGQGLRGPDIGKAMQDAEMTSYETLLGELRHYVRGVLEREIMFEHSSEFKPGSGIVVVRQFEDDWKVLCLHTEDFMDLPKGQIDPGEDSLSTALRETQEEASITDLQFKWGLQAIKISNTTMFVAATKQDPEITPNPHTGIIEHLGTSWLSWDDASREVKPWLSPCILWARKTILMKSPVQGKCL
jgi:tRNA nucleotidyltransferase/poly(A) polymerase/8-oxo-dGTP pyrophosphatase MutT (NUDIX family)